MNQEHFDLVKRGAAAVSQWNADNPSERLSLAGANLRGASLTKFDLRSADLSGAQLSEAELFYANLRGAYLHGADLRGSYLVKADLSKADLGAADLRGADLWATNLSGASLVKARLGGARCIETLFANVDLSFVPDLDEVFHDGPSTLGVDTLVRSGGAIPEVFLRGIGVSEELIASFRDHLGSPIEFYSCFMSYSHQDKAFARRLHDALQGWGIRCWLDEKALIPGQRILDVVNQAIRVHDKLLLCCSRSSLQSWWVGDEIDKALELERKNERDIIIPLNIDGYLFVWEDGRAATIRTRLAADFTGWEHDISKFEEQFERVVGALRPDPPAS